jgi:cysteine-rich repeat protein
MLPARLAVALLFPGLSLFVGCNRGPLLVAPDAAGGRDIFFATGGEVGTDDTPGVDALPDLPIGGNGGTTATGGITAGGGNSSAGGITTSAGGTGSGGITNGGYCGDGKVQPPEECDDGALFNNGDYGGCAPNCVYAPHCGDGIINGPEQCDDGILDGSYGGCTSYCKLAPHCGDGIITGPEQCDDGDQNGLDGLCSVNCKEIISPP